MIIFSNRATVILGILLLIYTIGRSWAGEHAATVTQLQGTVTLYLTPSENLADQIHETNLAAGNLKLSGSSVKKKTPFPKVRSFVPFLKEKPTTSEVLS